MSSPFQSALEAGDLAALRACPKADLHTHGGLGANREFLSAWAGRDLAPLDRRLTSMDDMHAWVGGAFGEFFATEEGRLKMVEAAFVQARHDGLARVELGTDVWAITQHDHSAQVLTDHHRRLHQLAAPDVEWIPQLGVSRHCAVRPVMFWMEPLLELGFYRTLDLAGDEFAQPIEVFKPIYRRAKAAGLRLKAHVGEWGTADDVWRAVEELELDEVQHGNAAAESPQVMAFLAEHGVRLNMCPTSNLMLGRVERLEDHPIRRLFDAGVTVTVNTDDVLVFGSSCSEEFLKLYQAGVMSAAELDQVRLNGLLDRG